MTEAITSEIYTVGPNVIPDTELESLAALLEASGRYRMLRRLEPRSEYCAPDGTHTRRAVYLDVETTGLDHASDEIIELAMVPFFYSDDGRIFGVGGSFERYRDPGRPIPPTVTELTGITDEMVAGRSIDPAEVEAFLGQACLVVAHNAKFDRSFAERFIAAFSRHEWACSWNDIDWKAEGFTDGAKLSNLATASGFFYEGHRAENDCRAGIEMLSRPLPKSGRLALDALLKSVLLREHRVEVSIRASGENRVTTQIAVGHVLGHASEGSPTPTLSRYSSVSSPSLICSRTIGVRRTARSKYRYRSTSWPSLAKVPESSRNWPRRSPESGC